MSMVFRPLTLAVTLALGLVMSGAQAQETLRLRANEHSSFSRLAIDLPEVSEWTSTQNDRSVEIVLTGLQASLNARAIFPDRRVSRVLSASAELRDGDTVITLSLACRCEVEAYDLAGAVLMLDVRDSAREVRRTAASTPRFAPDPTPATTPDQTSATQALEAPVEPAPAPVPQRSDAMPVAIVPPAALTEERTAAAPLPPAAPPPAEALPAARRILPSDDVAAVVAEAQRRLLEQLSRAAEQGLVDFRQPPEPEPEPAQDVARAPAEPAVAPADLPPAADAPEPERASVEPDLARDGGLDASVFSQISITSVFEKDARPRAKPVRASCVADARLKLPVVQSAEAPADIIARSRSALMSEFDVVSPRAAGDLARAYIALGFGAEAIAALGSLDAAVPDAALLGDLAKVVDGLPFAPDGPLSAASECPGQVSVWRLAAPDADGREVADGLVAAAAFAQALASIPPPLRHQLGAGVLTALVMAERMDAARQVVAVLDRAPGPLFDARKLAVAKFHAAEGRQTEADGALRELMDRSGPAAAEATALLIERRLARRVGVDDSLIEAAASAALIFRGTPLGVRLKAAEIRARGGDRFVEALDVLQAEVERMGAEDAVLQAVARDLFLAADPAVAGAVAYAGAAIARSGLMGEGPGSDPARVRAAGELTDMGLANAALTVLAASMGRSDDAALAAARARVALGQGAVALALIAARDDPAAEALKVAALVADGRHNEAWRDMKDTPEGDDVAKAAFAWRAGDWRSAAALAPDSPRAPFAAWASGIGPDAAARLVPALGDAAIAAMGDPPEGDPSLSGARALLARSRMAETFFQKAMIDG